MNLICQLQNQCNRCQPVRRFEEQFDIVPMSHHREIIHFAKNRNWEKKEQSPHNSH